MARIALVAGAGRLPVIFSDMAREKGDTVIAFCLKGVTDKELEKHVHKAHWFEWSELKKALFVLVTERIKSIIMLGKLKKEDLFRKSGSVGEEASKMIVKSDKKDYSLLNETAKMLGKLGVEVIDSTTYLKEMIPQKGAITKRSPDGTEPEDIKCGREVAKALSGFDIGQTVAVKDKTVIAVEAAEGTDEAISRAGSLVKNGFVVVKVARPNQDMRFDVPLVGLDTVKSLAAAGATALALEAGKMLLIDKEEIIKLAEEKNISIIAI